MAQERRIQRVAQAKVVPTTGFDIWTTTAGLLREQGPLAPIWILCLPQPLPRSTSRPSQKMFHREEFSQRRSSIMRHQQLFHALKQPFVGLTPWYIIAP